MESFIGNKKIKIKNKGFYLPKEYRDYFSEVVLCFTDDLSICIYEKKFFDANKVLEFTKCIDAKFENFFLYLGEHINYLGEDEEYLVAGFYDCIELWSCKNFEKCVGSISMEDTFKRMGL